MGSMKNNPVKINKSERTEKQIDFIKNLGLKILFNAIFLGVTIYFIAQFSNTSSAAIETERADLEIRQDIVELTGYIFRNEEVLYTNGGSKSVNYLIDDGQKVATKEVVAQINQNSNYDYSLLKDQIDAIDKHLAILQKSNINLEFVTTNLDKIENDSRVMYTDMLENIKKDKIYAAGKNRDDLLILLNKKQIITKEVNGSSFDSLIVSLQQQKSQLEAQMQSATGAYTDALSDKSGLFYSRTDGYENYFTGDAVNTIDFATFDNLISKNPDTNILNNALGKVAYDFNWYLVCKYDHAKQNKNFGFINGKTYDIIYPYSSNTAISSKLIRQIQDVNTGDILLVFETMSVPDGFDFSRKQTIQIVFNEVKGIRVPQEAVVVVDKNDLGTTEPSETDPNAGIMSAINNINTDNTTDTTGVPATSETDANGNIIKDFVSSDLIKGVYVLKGDVVYFRRLPDSEQLAAFDGYYLYMDPSERSNTGDQGDLQLNEDIIVSGKDLYNGKIIS
ncbi:MAG: hypothetical protein FWD71_07745 [Oscillospiraceae bacterium]|nr:hypothetical protein [Oscillospiraceae bacterium]